MSAKRAADEMTGRDKKKQKTAMARTIATQPFSASKRPTPAASAVAGPSQRVVRFEGLPGSIDVERFTEARAFEINAMHAAMKSARANSTYRAWQQLPRHLRRRAASHDVRRVPLRLRDKAKAEMDPARRKALGRTLPKRGKSKQLSRTATFLKRQQNKIWLETHLWHAKRMKMEDMWGYRLAVQPTEKSFRPSHRASVHGAILHDASYFGFIELKGPEHVLRAILEACCDLQGPSPGAKRFSNGSRTCSTHLYKRHAYPFGLIGPCAVMWQPMTPVSTQNNKQPDSAKNKKGKVRLTTLETVDRLVWIKVHPSIFDKIHSELHTAASFALEEVKKAALPDAKPCEVEIADLREHLNVFEIMGPKASQVIRGALRPVVEDTRPEFRKSWNALGGLQTTASVPRNMVIGFKVYDPRLSFPPKNAKVHHDVNNASKPAVAFYPTSVLAQSEIWDGKVQHDLRKPRYKKKDIDERKSKNLVPGTPLQAGAKDDRIPILLVQRSLEGTSTSPSIHGWTLFIPSGWAMAFLSSLMFTGTRVGGQRERQTQAFEAGCSSFPRDYPTTETYDIVAEDRACEEKRLWDRKPPAKRPNYEALGSRSPWKPDWEVVLDIQNESAGVEEDLMEAQREEAMVIDVPKSSASNQHKVQLWLLRGLDIQAALDAASSTSNRPIGLIGYINGLRQKRGMDALAVSGEDLWKGALVRVSVRMVSRGCPEDSAVIYGMDDEEAQKWMKAERIRKNDVITIEEDAEDETELSVTVPSPENIIGYVTTGNFSLSLGEGSAVGAIPLGKLVELKEQAQRLSAGRPLVKVRERHEVICRAAYLEVLAD